MILKVNVNMPNEEMLSDILTEELCKILTKKLQQNEMDMLIEILKDEKIKITA